MCAFIVNPPIRDDQDYYREDDSIVDDILAGQSMLAIGLRRSGKTSFLLRVERAARRAGRACASFDVVDTAADVPEQLSAIRELTAGGPGVIVLLDEVERWRSWPTEALRELFHLLRSPTVVLTGAPQFVLDLAAEPEFIQQRLEGFRKHRIGPLSDDEARALLSRKRRGTPGFDEVTVERLLERAERLPIVLQALGAEVAEGVDLATSLAGFGQRVLSGLTADARELFIAAAHGEEIDGQRSEAKLLAAIGALRRDRELVRIGSPLLAELVKEVSPRARRVDGAPMPEWKLHARILHLSDLHFGKSIDPPAVQASRLIAALERDGRVPHFIAITGDLSWTGSPVELHQAEEFVEKLAAWLHERLRIDELESRRRVIMVPGNHEASWNLSRGVPVAGHDIWLAYSLAPFANFAHRFYRGAVRWDLDAPCTALTFADPAVTFLALSTAHFVTEQRAVGKFGQVVRDRAVALLGQPEVAASRFRVGLWHHNLRAFQEDGQHIADIDVAASAFVRSRPSIEIVLHGHVHQGEVEEFRPRGNHPPLPYSAVGSFGVTADHRPGDAQRGVTPNEMALVELEIGGTARRSTTRYYELDLDPNGQWAWHERRASPPRAL